MSNRSLKILYLAHRIPYPPNKGDKIRSFNKVKHLSMSHEVDLVCLSDNPDYLQFEKELNKYCHRIFVLPLRPLQAKIQGSFSFAVGKAISVGYYYRKKIQQTMDHWLLKTNYDAIICFSSSMAEYVFRSRILNSLQGNRQVPRLIMDFCDVDSDKWLQYSNQTKFPLNLTYRLESKRLLGYEKKINQIFDCSVFVSQREADLFQKLYPRARNLRVIPNGVDYEYFAPNYSTYSTSTNSTTNRSFIEKAHQAHKPNQLKNRLIFTGAMDYYANIDGVKWFCKKIFPLVKAACPETRFYIAGSNPDAEVRDLGKSKDIVVTGFVEDIRPYYQQSDVCVTPLRLARGVQNKVLEAMSMGKAVVTTSAAIQGISAIPGEHLLVADTPEKFANAVSMLLKAPVLRLQLGNSARRFVKKHYYWQANMKQLENILIS